MGELGLAFLMQVVIFNFQDVPMNRYTKSILLMTFILFLSACASTPKPEKTQYREMQNSFRYLTYETLSENTVNPSLALYNKKLKGDDRSEVHPEIVHSLAAVVLALGKQHKWATAEANLALKAADDDAGRYVAYSALSIALHSNGWEGLGTQYAARASVIENGKALDDKYQASRLTVKAILGISAILRGDGPAAEELFSELGNQTGNDWLPIAVHGAAIIADGKDLSTVSDLKALANRDGVSYSEKQKLAELQAIAETYKGEPKQMKAKTNEIVKQWSMDALSVAGEAAIDATLKMVGGLILLLGRF